MSAGWRQSLYDCGVRGCLRAPFTIERIVPVFFWKRESVRVWVNRDDVGFALL